MVLTLNKPAWLAFVCSKAATNGGTEVMHNVTDAETVYGVDGGVSSSFIGFAGLAGTAPLKLLRYKELNNSLAVQSRIRKSVLEMQVPMLAKMHEAMDSGIKVTEFQSKSGKTINKWREEKTIQVWHPELLSSVLSIGDHTIKPTAIIHGVVRALEETEESGEGSIANPILMEHWEKNIRSLWVRAVLNSSSVSEMLEPVESKAVYKFYMEMLRKKDTFNQEGRQEERESVELGGGGAIKSLHETDVPAQITKEGGNPLKQELEAPAREIAEGTEKVTGTPKRRRSKASESARLPRKTPRKGNKNENESAGNSGESNSFEMALRELRYQETDQQVQNKREKRYHDFMRLMHKNIKIMKEVVEGNNQNNKAIMRTFTTAIFESADLRREEQKEKSTEKKNESLLGEWTHEDRVLFQLILAKDWEVQGTPSLNKFASSLMDLKKRVTKGIRMIQRVARENNWVGKVIASGLPKLLREGFIAEDIDEAPGGLLVFLCKPRSVIDTRSVSEEKQFIQHNFGNGKLNEEVLEDLAKKVWYLPTSLHEAKDMIPTTVKLLDLLTSEGSIASQGYRFGLECIDEKMRTFAKAYHKDKLFLVKYLYLLDLTFQDFCRRLVKYEGRTNPIEAAANRLKNYQVKSIFNEVKKTKAHGVVPWDLITPLVFKRGVRPDKGKLMGATMSRSLDGAILSQGRQEEKTNKAKEKGKDPAWFKTDPKPEAAWRIPKGKSFGNFFRGERGKENQKGFPKFKHHKTGKSTFICLGYQLKGFCKQGPGCFNAHVESSKMKADKKQKVANRLAAVYASA